MPTRDREAATPVPLIRISQQGLQKAGVSTPPLPCSLYSSAPVLTVRLRRTVSTGAEIR